MGACTVRSEKTYELSHHLVDKEVFADIQTYSHKVQKIIEDVDTFEKQVMDNRLAKYIANRLDIWFLEDDKQKKQNINIDLQIFQKLNQKKKKLRSIEFAQLNDQQTLRKFFLKIEEQFMIAESMNQIVNRLPHNKKDMKLFYQGNSVRKDQQQQVLSLNSEKGCISVLQALVGSYYLKVLKREGSTDDAQLSQFLYQFHLNCGIPLIRFMSKEILSSHQLMSILFQLLTVFSKSAMTQKADIPKLIRTHVSKINDKFKSRLIIEQHTYTVSKSQLLNLKYLGNCYVSDLYKASLNEIENPQIEEEPDNHIKSVNTFPVHTVKQSYKKY